MKLGLIALVFFIIFMILKLTAQIDWSWWWVTAPIWIYIILCILLGILLALYIASLDPEERLMFQMRYMW